MGLASNFAICAVVPVAFGYIAFMIVNLVGSIKVLVHKGDSTCTSSSFKWIWWICISSALFAWDLLQRNAAKKEKSSSVDLMKDMSMMAFVYVACSLGFALGTQIDYLDGCNGPAHQVMFIYMCGHYTVALGIVLIASLLVLDNTCSAKPQTPEHLSVVASPPTGTRTDYFSHEP